MRLDLEGGREADAGAGVQNDLAARAASQVVVDPGFLLQVAEPHRRGLGQRMRLRQHHDVRLVEYGMHVVSVERGRGSAFDEHFHVGHERRLAGELDEPQIQPEPRELL